MKKIAIIHGYRSKDILSLYVEKVSQYISKWDFDIIISLGWFTDITSSESEANMIKKLVESKLVWNQQYKRILEECSFTTFENIKQCKNILNQFPENNITVFCQNTHLPKIVYLSLINYCGYSGKETIKIIQEKWQNHDLKCEWDSEFLFDWISFLGFDLWAGVSKYWNALWSSIIETHYDEYPEIHDDFVEYRKNLRNIK